MEIRMQKLSLILGLTLSIVTSSFADESITYHKETYQPNKVTTVSYENTLTFSLLHYCRDFVAANLENVYILKFSKPYDHYIYGIQKYISGYLGSEEKILKFARETPEKFQTRIEELCREGMVYVSYEWSEGLKKPLQKKLDQSKEYYDGRFDFLRRFYKGSKANKQKLIAALTKEKDYKLGLLRGAIDYADFALSRSVEEDVINSLAILKIQSYIAKFL